MALAHYPSIVTNGLIFYYDMNNVRKSWKGPPITNQFALPTADVNGFGVQNSTFTRVRSGKYGGYEIQPTDYVWRYNISSNDCPYHGNDVTINSGQTAVFSFDYYVDPSTSNYPITNYLANFEGVVSGSVGDPTPSIKGVWKRAVFTATAGSTGLCRMLLYPGGCGGRLGDSGFILYRNPQVEFNPPGNIPTQFVAGTRASTQAILDYVGGNTITANSLTYNADGTFQFDYSSAYLTSSGLDSYNWGTTLSVEAWLYHLGGTGFYRGVITNGTDADRLGGFDLRFGREDYYGGGNNGTALNWHITNTSETRVSISTYVPANQWKHVVATYDGTTSKTYVDGVLFASAAQSGIIKYSGYNSPIIGRSPGTSEYFDGKISSVKVYNRALSAAEVLQNYNSSKAKYKGSSADNAASSALEILAANPNSASGTYWIDLPGLGPTQCYCDMTTAGGGWIHIGTFSDNNEASNNSTNHPWGAPLNPAQNTGIWEDPTTLGSQSFTSDFKSAAWSRYYMNQMLIKDQGATQRNLLYTTTPLGTRQTMSYFWSQRTWAATGSDGSNSAYSAGRVYGLAITTFGTADPVLDASNKSILLFKYGEADGAQDENKDRTMIAWHRHNAADGVDAPVGIGCFTNRSGSIDYRDIVPIANSADWPQSSITGAPLNYTLWVR